MRLMPSPISRTIRLLLLGPHAIGRAGLRLLVESGRDMAVIGETASASEAIRLASLEQPDIVLMDLNNHDGAYLDCLPSLFEATRVSRVLVLMEGQDHELGQHAVRLGAIGIVLKDNPPDVLIAAIQKVYAGEAWLDRFTIAAVLTEMSRGTHAESESGKGNGIASLTKREREVITLVAMEGLRNKQIAERLFISDITVRHHLTSVFGKLLVSDRFELMIYAYRHGLAVPAETPLWNSDVLHPSVRPPT
jgi:DNA-binding NarL/FixJ family response regulator